MHFSILNKGVNCVTNDAFLQKPQLMGLMLKSNYKTTQI